MVTTCTSFCKSAVASSNASMACSDKRRVSTETLGMTLFAVNTLMGAVACWYNPEAALTGALAGALIRRVIGDNARSEISDQERRHNRIALMCCTILATGFTATVAGATAPVTGSYLAPLFVGFEASTNGVYPLLRKLIG